MKIQSKLGLASVLLAATLGLSACDIDKEQDGDLPDVDVNVEGGELPEYDVDAPDVDVGTEQKTITVPDIDVDMPEEADPMEAPPAGTTPPATTGQQ
ncbi:hypothetical protein JQR85_00880 [Stutzerimonas urumqiensis]|uniref:hypothetical protein n=1 Tax=Stutzerimonas urumqiensis TaxID=638269 RepID=UPI003DA52715